MKARRTAHDRFLMPLLLALSACGRPDASPPAGAAADAGVMENPMYVEKPSFFGYITATTLSVRGGPGTDAAAVGYLFKGDRVDIYETREVAGIPWLRIADAAGYLDGWVSGRFVSGTPVLPTPPPPTGYGERRTPTAVMTVTARYVGTAACQRCHSEPRGGPFPQGEYGVWINHYHAAAHRTLTRPYTRALAQQKRGVQDPATDWRCLKCHVTAYGVPAERLGPGYRHEDGVSCEACHGPGGDYLLSHWRGQRGFESREAAGFVIYRDLDDRDRLCRSCHNPLSPTYKPFNVASFSAAIRHWTGEHEVREVADEAEVAAEAPRPIAEAPPPRVDTLEAPPPVRTIVPPAAAAPPPPAAPAPPARRAPAARDEGPVDMVLGTRGTRGRVPFPHRKHFEWVTPSPGAEACITCHHTSQRGETPDPCSSCHQMEATADAPSAEKAHHGTCKDCHREEQAGPRKCSECHIR